MTKQMKCALGLVCVVLFGGAVWIVVHHQTTPARPSGALITSDPRDQMIQRLEAQLTQSTSTDSVLEKTLSQLYLQRVRETADISFYTRVDELLNQAERKQPNDADVFATRATIDLGRHEFVRALALAEKAIRLEPARAAYYGILGDAYIELGQDEKAVEAFQNMVDLEPNLAAFSRIAYARELRGDIEGAIEAMKLSVEARSSIPENLAWIYVQLGNLYLRHNIDQAAEAYRSAQALLPDGYPPALKGLARVAFAKQDRKEAEHLWLETFRLLPTAEYAIDAADFYTVTGDELKAKQYQALADVAFQVAAKGGVKTELESAIFLADHARDLPRALVQAEAAYRDRPSIHGADALAWARAQNGRLDEVEPLIRSALRLGEHDPMILFHVGMIRLKQGKQEEGARLLRRAIELHPLFSIKAVAEIKRALEKK